MLDHQLVESYRHTLTHIFSLHLLPSLTNNHILPFIVFCRLEKYCPTKTKRYESKTCLFRQSLVYLSLATIPVILRF